MAEMMEEYFVLSGMDAKLANITEEQLKSLVQEMIVEKLRKLSLSQMSATEQEGFQDCNISLTGLVKKICSYDVGMPDSKEGYHLLRLKYAQNQHLVGHIIALNENVTLHRIPDEVAMECELKWNIDSLEAIPNMNNHIESLLNNVGLKIYFDRDGDFWLAGRWFEVAVFKRSISKAYIRAEKDAKLNTLKTNIHLNEQQFSAVKNLLNGGTSQYSTQGDKTKSVYCKSHRQYDFSLLMLTYCYYTKTLHSVRHAVHSVSFTVMPDRVHAVINVCACDSDADKYLADVDRQYDDIAAKHYSAVLPFNLPWRYKEFLQEIVDAKYDSVLSIRRGGTFSFVLLCKDNSNVNHFIARYLRMNSPSHESSDMTVLKNCIVPYPDKLCYAKATARKDLCTRELNKDQQCECQDYVNVVIQAKEDHFKEETAVPKKSFIAIFKQDAQHLKYLSIHHRQQIKELEEKYGANINLTKDDFEVETTERGKAHGVLTELYELYLQTSLVTRNIPSMRLEANTNTHLIIEATGSSGALVTGPREVVDALENAGNNTTVIPDEVGKSIHDTRMKNSYEAATEEGSGVQTTRRRRQLIDFTVSTGQGEAYQPLAGNCTFQYKATVGVTTFQHKSTGTYIEIGKGDITQLEFDAIVNAANKELKHYGGIAYAIAKAAGPAFNDECQKVVRHKPLETTDAVVTSGGNLHCKMVIHAVGPCADDYRDKNECYASLKQTFMNILQTASQYNVTTIAIPAISSGIYKVPLSEVAKKACSAIQDFLSTNSATNVKVIRLIDMNQDMIDSFHKELKKMVNKKHIILVDSSM